MKRKVLGEGDKIRRLQFLHAMVKREVSLPSFLLYCGGVAFLASALSTQYWITCQPHLELPVGSEIRKYSGSIHFGLFKGVKTMDVPGKVDKEQLALAVVCSASLSVCLYSDKGSAKERSDNLQANVDFVDGAGNATRQDIKLLSMGMWASTVVFVTMAVLAGLVGAVFAVVNSVMTPVDFITGLYGLCIWSTAGAVFSLLAVALWAAAYHSILSANIMSFEELHEGWSSAGRSSLGHSFWFVLVATFFYLANGMCVLALLKRPWRNKGNATRIRPASGQKIQDQMLY